MGQKHSAKYSLKKSGGNNKQQTVKIEDEIAFNTDSPGRASDDPIGVNLSSNQNDYIRNAANNMAKIWTETAVIESNGRNEKGNDGKENKSSNNGEGVEANMPEMDKSSVPDNLINENEIQEKPADEEPVPNNEGDVIQNIVVPEISQEEQQKVTPIAEKPTIHQIECTEEENIVPDDDEQILSNTTAEECDENIQQIVGKNDTQPKEIELEAKMDLYEENGSNEVKEIDKNELEKVKTAEVIEMPNEINKNSMEMLDEQNEVTQHKEEEVVNHLMLENAEHQNPILEGIADYVANQQNVQSDGNEPEEVKSVETESDGKENFVSKNEDEKHHTEIETEDFENSNISSMPMLNVDAIMDDPKISTGIDNELKEVNQNGHKNECQKLAKGIDDGEPNSTGKPSEL